MRMSEEPTNDTGYSYLNQSQVGNHGLDLLDDLWFGPSIKRFELHVEDRLFFWFFLEIVGTTSVTRLQLYRGKEELVVPPQRAQQRQEQQTEQQWLLAWQFLEY